MLASPTAFNWASSFLGAATFTHLQDQSTSLVAPIPFCLPQSQPQMDLLPCSKNLPSLVESLEYQLPVEDFNSLSVSAHSPSSAADLASPATPLEKVRDRVAKSSGPWSKSLVSLVAKGKKPDDNTGPKVRRSLRQKQLHKGFKASASSNMNC
jgi:hypothetical protein